MYCSGLSILSIVLVACQVRFASARTLDPSWTTDPTQFFRRGYHSSVLLGETLYIDGGDGYHMPSNGSVIQVDTYNSTYALDLSTSWSPKDVQFHVISKGDSPILNRPNLWPAPDGKSFYSINGDVSEALQYPWSQDRNPPVDPQLWQFTPNGTNDGAWGLVENVSSLVGSSLSRSTYGNGSVYIVGGITTWRSSYRYANDTGFVGSADGILSHDTGSQTWSNESMVNLASSGWWLEGELQWIDSLGGIGVALAMGGVTALSGATLAGNKLVPFDHVTLFNPLTGEWREQATSGSIPPSRRRACSVGVPGDNGTYEIFLYGGDASATNYEVIQTTPSPESVDLDQVWVLSIPSFAWYKSNYTASDARYVHTCHVPGNPPRRQMIAVGGTIPGLTNYAQSADAWPQGLAIFDLTQMEWIDSYAADAASYRTPQLVRDGIAENGSYPQTWNDPVVVEWLLGKSLKDITSTSNTTIGNSSKHRRGRSTGTMVAIAVGSIAVLALLGLFLWYFLQARYHRYRSFSGRTDTSPYQKAELGYEKPELDVTVIEKQPPVSRNPSRKHELAETVVRYEMEGSAADHELGTDTTIYSKNTLDEEKLIDSATAVDSMTAADGITATESDSTVESRSRGDVRHRLL